MTLQAMQDCVLVGVPEKAHTLANTVLIPSIKFSLSTNAFYGQSQRSAYRHNGLSYFIVYHNLFYLIWQLSRSHALCTSLRKHVLSGANFK